MVQRVANRINVLTTLVRSVAKVIVIVIIIVLYSIHIVVQNASAPIVSDESGEDERDGGDEQRVEAEREEERGARYREHERRADHQCAHQIRRALHDE